MIVSIEGSAMEGERNFVSLSPFSDHANVRSRSRNAYHLLRQIFPSMRLAAAWHASNHTRDRREIIICRRVFAPCVRSPFNHEILLYFRSRL